MTNKALLSLIAILLVGILSVGVIHAVDKQNPESLVEKLNSNIDEAAEEIQDEYDDHTDDR